jgi:predicted DsbA family dithiol-disulfide isomerase
VSSSAGTLFGLSNIPLGLGFYGVVAVLTVAIFGLGPRWRRWVHAARVILLAVGTGYAGYLVYVQIGVLGTVCGLCLVSMTFTAGLLIGQGTIILRAPRTGDAPLSPRLFRRDLLAYVYLTALAAVLIGADLVYFDPLLPVQAEQTTVHDRQFGGAACQLDPAHESIDPARLVHARDLRRGAPDAAVTVIEYFDPNCPRCKAVHETMTTLVSRHEDEVRFVFKPFPMQGSSLPEIQALYVADQQGKFFEMLRAQYARQRQSGIDTEDLRAIAREIGIDPEGLVSRIENDAYRQHVLEQRKRALEVGVESPPTVLIDGHVVGSRSLECMETFIARAKRGALPYGPAR